MIRTYVLPFVALLGLLFAVGTVVRGAEPTPVAAPIAEPARAPFETFVAGAGLVESSTENIAVGSPVSGIVTQVVVRPGDRVKAGAPLFTLDDRDLQASMLPARARLVEAQAGLDRARARLRLVESVRDPRAVSAEELVNRRADVALGEAAVASAGAEIERLGIEIDRRTVRALVDGQILQVKVRPGEMALAGALATPLVLLGDHSRLHVRVDIDENDAWRFRPGTPAVAFVRGNPALGTKLRFERVEPYVVPKVSLTGQSSERVDTRVLQVLYSFDEGALPIYVGQQMDVFLEAPSAEAAASAVPPPAPSAPAATGDTEVKG